MEHTLTSHILQHLEMNNIPLPSQFGFRVGHSCESQLLIVTDDFARVLNSWQQIDNKLLDLSKAFDSIPHTWLLYKSSFYGIMDIWLHDYSPS